MRSPLHFRNPDKIPMVEIQNGGSYDGGGGSGGVEMAQYLKINITGYMGEFVTCLPRL